jgi:hypothetical protein
MNFPNISFFHMVVTDWTGSLRPIICVIANGVTGQAQNLYINIQHALIILMALVYIAFWVYIKFMNSKLHLGLNSTESP